jgi:predicted metalloprotease
MLWKGRRQSGNVEDIRTSGRRSVGFKGGIIGTIVIAVVVYLLGGNPMQVLNLGDTGQSSTVEQTELTAHDKEMGDFVSVVLADTEDVWNKLFSEMGGTYREPKLVLFRGGVKSACGFAEEVTGPFYCSADEKVYIDLTYLEELQQRLGAQGDFAVAYILAHEVGHHVQNLLGKMEKRDEMRASGSSEEEINEMTVRVELQADFLAGVWVHHAQKMQNILEEGDLGEALNAAAAVGDDRIQMKTRGYVVPDSFTHGTSEQRRKWLSKGIETGDVNQGDTFNARKL